MSRKDLAELIKKPSNNPAVKAWRMKTANKKITINLETGILDQAKREKLMKLIDEKMKEFSESL